MSPVVHVTSSGYHKVSSNNTSESSPTGSSQGSPSIIGKSRKTGSVQKAARKRTTEKQTNLIEKPLHKQKQSLQKQSIQNAPKQQIPTVQLPSLHQRDVTDEQLVAIKLYCSKQVATPVLENIMPSVASSEQPLCMDEYENAECYVKYSKINFGGPESEVSRQDSMESDVSGIFPPGTTNNADPNHNRDLNINFAVNQGATHSNMDLGLDLPSLPSRSASDSE